MKLKAIQLFRAFVVLLFISVSSQAKAQLNCNFNVDNTFACSVDIYVEWYHIVSTSCVLCSTSGVVTINPGTSVPFSCSSNCTGTLCDIRVYAITVGTTPITPVYVDPATGNVPITIPSTACPPFINAGLLWSGGQAYFY